MRSELPPYVANCKTVEITFAVWQVKSQFSCVREYAMVWTWYYNINITENFSETLKATYNTFSIWKAADAACQLYSPGSVSMQSWRINSERIPKTATIFGRIIRYINTGFYAPATLIVHRSNRMSDESVRIVPFEGASLVGVGIAVGSFGLCVLYVDGTACHSLRPEAISAAKSITDCWFIIVRVFFFPTQVNLSMLFRNVARLCGHLMRADLGRSHPRTDFI